MKRSLTLLTALGLTASMICTGCGNGNTTETASSSSSKSDVKAESTPEATPEPTEEAVSTVSEPVEETKKERDGFKDGTVEYELDGLTFSIPTYFGDASSTNENGSSWSNDENTVLLAIYQLGSNVNYTDDNIKRMEQQVPDALLSKLGVTSYSINERKETTVAGYPGYEFTAAIPEDSNGTTGELVATIIFNTSNGYATSVMLATEDTSTYLYDSDYDSIIDNITASEGTTSGSSSSSTTIDSSEVTPELKEFLDSYEAFVDQYVEFMKQYSANPTDVTLLSEYSDYITKLADFEKKANAYQSEEGSMSTADYNYYVDVMARVSKKLLQASSEISGTSSN